MKFLLSLLLLIPSIGLTDDYRMGCGKDFARLQGMLGKAFSPIGEPYSPGSHRQWQSDSILYIDTSGYQTGHQDLLQDAWNHRATILLDNTRLLSSAPDEVAKTMMAMIGVGIDSPYVIVDSSGIQPTLSMARTMDNVVRQLNNTAAPRPGSDTRPVDPTLTGTLQPPPREAMNESPERYFPGRRFNIRIQRNNFTCELYRSTDKNVLMDYCDGNASIDLLVNVAFMRSVAISDTTDPNNQTPDAKFVRFSVSADNGTGAGIHLRDELIQENAWFQSTANRHTRLGPYAKSYAVTITPRGFKGQAPVGHLRYAIPLSQKINTKGGANSALELGIHGQAVYTGVNGPRNADEANALVKLTDTRTLSWDTHEYETINSTTDNKFAVTWERAFGYCRELVDGKCDSNIHGLTDGGPIFNEEAFSPVAYKRFAPNIDVVYEAAPDASGITTYNLHAEFFAMARYGRVKPSFFFTYFEPDGFSVRQHGQGYDISVDWEHPLFEPQPHIKLRSINEDLCLQATGEVATLNRCFHSDLNQLWGLDSQEHYRSRSAKGLCLDGRPDGTLQIIKCNNNQSQKWYWEGDRLFCRFSPTSERRVLVFSNANLPPDTPGALEANDVKLVPESEADGYYSLWRNELTNIF